MADPFAVLLQQGQQYANDELATNPWMMGSKAVQGTKLTFDNPWMQLASNLGQTFAGAGMQQLAQNDYKNDLNSAYGALLKGASGQQKIEPQYQPYLAPVQAAFAQDRYSTAQDIAKEDRAQANRIALENLNYKHQLDLVGEREKTNNKGLEIATPEELTRARGILMANGVAKDADHAAQLLPQGVSRAELDQLAFKGEARRGASASGDLTRPMPLPEEARKRVSAALKIDESLKPVLAKLDSVVSKLPKDKAGKFFFNSLESALPTTEAQDLKANLEFLAYQYVVDAQGRGASDAEQQLLRSWLAGNIALSTGELKNRLLRMANSTKQDARFYLKTLREPQFAENVSYLTGQIPADFPLTENFGGGPKIPEGWQQVDGHPELMFQPGKPGAIMRVPQ